MGNHTQVEDVRGEDGVDGNFIYFISNITWQDYPLLLVISHNFVKSSRFRKEFQAMN